MIARKHNISLLLISLPLIIILDSCKPDYTPRPRGYFRIDFPEKEYEKFKSECGFSFQKPKYMQVDTLSGVKTGKCWYNLINKKHEVTIYLTYKDIKNNLSSYTEDARTMTYKHAVKADDIIERPIWDTTNNIYGMLYEIEGNVASSINFYLTDNVTSFIRGALYFNKQPNIDSLAPAIEFYKEDILYFIETFSWE